MQITKMIRIIILMLAATSLAQAGVTGHYVNGVEGVKAASVPPPGYYYRLYNLYYSSSSLKDENSNELNVGFDISVFATVNRFIWVSSRKIWGADYFMDIVVPLINVDLSIDALDVNDDQQGVGDINIEPLGLAWHGDSYDTALALSFYVPTGDYSLNEPASVGKGFWTTMLSFGFTYYADADRTWSVSMLNRYEVHGRNDKNDVTAGDDFHFEWGVSKALSPVLELGVSGYAQWQVSDDSGGGVSWDPGVHDRVYAIGPELNYVIPSYKLAITLKNQTEFNAKDRPQDSVTVLTLTKAF